jgi:hypothetical protein
MRRCRLDVRQSPVRWNDKFITHDSVGENNLDGINLFVPAPQYIMQHSASAEGLYYGGGEQYP